MAMLKGEIKSEMIEDVQKEFDKIGSYTIERIFAFDKNTDIGPIQIGDRFHGCASGEGLKPNEGTKCEKRLIKDFDKIQFMQKSPLNLNNVLPILFFIFRISTNYES